jgi:hypothetical protein
MQGTVATLCLLGALCANAQNDTCQDELPVSCQMLCTELRLDALHAPDITLELAKWLLGDLRNPDCEMDARRHGQDSRTCTRIRKAIVIWAESAGCVPLSICYAIAADCLFRNPDDWSACGF